MPPATQCSRRLLRFHSRKFSCASVNARSRPPVRETLDLWKTLPTASLSSEQNSTLSAVAGCTISSRSDASGPRVSSGKTPTQGVSSCALPSAIPNCPSQSIQKDYSEAAVSCLLWGGRRDYPSKLEIRKTLGRRRV